MSPCCAEPGDAQALLARLSQVIQRIVQDSGGLNILSAEIIVISLNVVAEAPLYQQILTLVVIALAMTVGVYGLVAGIVRLDDAGFALAKSKAQGVWGKFVKAVGRALVSAAPVLMKALSWIGTIAMFLVGGTFVAEGILPLEHAIETVVAASGGWGAVVKVGLFGVVGAVAGFITAITVSGFSCGRKLRAQ